MKKIRKFINEYFRLIYSIFPFAVGLYYYVPFFREKSTNYPVLDALYASFKLYSGSIADGMNMTLALHITRFMALAITFSILIKVFNKLSALINWFKLRSSKSYVIYGDSVYANQLCKSIGGQHCVHGGKKLIPNSNNYIIMFGDDETNISFYADNYEAMKDSNVTIMLENVERQNIRNNKITVFNIPECCARFYWKKFYPTKSEKIAIIGFGKVGQNILTFGLQMNIISPDQHFEYHIWGNSEEFVSLHTQLDKMQPDEVIFHHDKWYKETEKISECDRVILCAAENNNLEVLSKLFAAGRCRNNVYIYAPNEKIVETMFGSDNNVFCFGNASEVASTDVIINENTLAEAKAQHSFYVEKYGASPWEELDSFTRYSNISSSDFDYVLRRLYHEEKVPLETLAHLEHIRWCRYYYLNNWRYGSVRNNAERVHTCLIPYEELSDEEKLKDFESIKVKL